MLVIKIYKFYFSVKQLNFLNIENFGAYPPTLLPQITFCIYTSHKSYYFSSIHQTANRATHPHSLEYDDSDAKLA